MCVPVGGKQKDNTPNVSEMLKFDTYHHDPIEEWEDDHLHEDGNANGCKQIRLEGGVIQEADSQTYYEICSRGTNKQTCILYMEDKMHFIFECKA